ncbi:hypothetical protein LTR56_020731 [Elasticomyces elasticus]|nr:hypothetical protein LTR56_020731 [Elasticomyces elasticus]KAK4914969.1 hypothetical protein LTR49_016834 [Elasticomyces elasticus]KAK5748658.1 hypothetical protein LTS12_021291 [Elasticomyces elasticus]
MASTTTVLETNGTAIGADSVLIPGAISPALLTVSTPIHGVQNGTKTTYDHNAFWARASKYLMNTGMPYWPTIVKKAKGTILYDVDDKRLLDFTSGQMSSLLGHGHPEIVEVIVKYATELDHLMSLMVSEPVVNFAEALAQILPVPLKKSFLLSTGSESVEAAIKIAKCATGKFEIVAFSASYHGSTAGSASATYAFGRKGAGPTIPGQLVFPAPNSLRSPFRKVNGSYDWETEMDFGWSLVDKQSVGSLAAFVFEPILSAGGMYEPPPGYMKRLSLEVQKRGMLLIADEAQTGLARTGDMFAFQRDDIVPDILALSKTLGGGMAVSSVSTTEEIEQQALAGGFICVTTHYNDPLPAAIGTKILEIIVRDDMVQYVRERGDQLRKGLGRMQAKYDCIGEIRGRGLFIGMEIVKDKVSNAPAGELTAAFSTKALELGLATQVVAIPGVLGVFRLAPPINVSVEEVDEALRIMDEAFASVLAAGDPTIPQQHGAVSNDRGFQVTNAMASEAFSLSSSTANPPQDSTILITGGASGIGLATALYLHTPAYSNNVVVLDRSASPPPVTELTKSPRFLYIQCDVTSWQSQRSAFAQAASHYGRLDHIFVNAGVAEIGEQIFTDHKNAQGELAEPDRITIDIDIRAVGDSLKLAIHHLRSDAVGKGSGKGRGGNIVMTASLAGYLASAGAPLYSAAKHGVVGYLRALKGDCANVGISLSVIAPGITLTNIILGRQEGQSLAAWGEDMQKRGVPINDAETVALTVSHIMGLRMKSNGNGYLIQGNRVQELEGGIAKSREVWMGKEMLDLFRGGRNAPLFPNKL